MTEEVIAGLNVKNRAQYIDATLGDGGHAVEIIKQGGRLLGIDRDPEQIERAQANINQAYGSGNLRRPAEGDLPKLVCANFADLVRVAGDNGFTAPQGILFDLGVSTPQLESPTKGLSFQEDLPLDMRLSPEISRTAADLVNSLDEKELYEIFIRNVQEQLAWPIARALVSARNLKPIATTGELARVIAAAGSPRRGKIHPATKAFLALRMEVNREIENLTKGIDGALKILAESGRLVVMSFHETEDRLVKQKFKKAKTQKIINIITKKPLTPGRREIRDNPRSRSAKLRIVEKIC